MANKLLIFGENKPISREYIRNNSYCKDEYETVIIIGSGSGIRGFDFNDIDILFLRGWWNRTDTKNILDVLYIYISLGSCIIGDKKYIPSYFYRDFFKVHVPIESRFDILDL